MRYCPRCAHLLVEKLTHGKVRPGCPACGFIYFHDPKLAVGVVADGEGRVLLVKRAHDPKRGCWSFPSGYVDAGEVVEEAALREVAEETGLAVRLEGLLGVYSEAENPVVFIAYAGTVIGGSLTPTDEVLEVGFFGPEEAPELAFSHDAQVLADWRVRYGGSI